MPTCSFLLSAHILRSDESHLVPIPDAKITRSDNGGCRSILIFLHGQAKVQPQMMIELKNKEQERVHKGWDVQK